MYSIILPAYKEAENLNLIIDKIYDLLKDFKFEIIVVDDDSQDDTTNIINNKKTFFKNIIFINRKNKNRSLAKSIYDGYLASSGDFIIIMDCDFNHNPDYLIDLINLNKKFNYDLICCSRYINKNIKINEFRYKLSKLYNYFLRLALSSAIFDNLSGFFLIKRNILGLVEYNKVFFGYGDYYFRLLYFLQRMNIKIYEFPVIYEKRKFGKSKTRFVKVFIKYTHEALKFLYNEKY